MQSGCHEDSARCEGELEATAPPPIPHNASFEAWLGMRPNAGDPKQPRPTPRHDATAHDTATRQREREGHDQRPQPPEPLSSKAPKEKIPSQGCPKENANNHVPDTMTNIACTPVQGSAFCSSQNTILNAARQAVWHEEIIEGERIPC